jgi:tetratricopeptide (TPR) repeat protein
MTDRSGSLRRSATPAGLLTLLLLAAAGPGPVRASDADLMRLLEKGSCPGCRLQDADLVHADLRDADLRKARLQRANLSQARLDGARLNGADLSGTSLRGASLRGADLRGARLHGTDLRQSDLLGAQLDADALSHSHWQQATGLADQSLSYAQLHNAGVEAAQAGRLPEAERFFGAAIQRQPDAVVSWAARGLSRSELGRQEEAAADLDQAAALLSAQGDLTQAEELRTAAQRLREPEKKPKSGNGLGGQLITGAAGMAQVLLPLASKFLVPRLF